MATDHMAVLAALVAALLLQAGLARGQQSGFAGSRMLLASNGKAQGLVVPLIHKQTFGKPRGLLRNGTLPIHGAVREGCVAVAASARSLGMP